MKEEFEFNQCDFDDLVHVRGGSVVRLERVLTIILSDKTLINGWKIENEWLLFYSNHSSKSDYNKFPAPLNGIELVSILSGYFREKYKKEKDKQHNSVLQFEIKKEDDWQYPELFKIRVYWYYISK